MSLQPADLLRATLVFLLYGGLGLASMFVLARALWTRRAYRQSVEGEILSSGVGTMFGDSVFYRPEVRYTYEVQGQRHEGTRLSLSPKGSDLGTRAQAEGWAGRYVPGKRVPVFHRADRPGDAVLERNLRLGSVAPLLFGATLFLVMGAMAAASSLRHTR